MKIKTPKNTFQFKPNSLWEEQICINFINIMNEQRKHPNKVVIVRLEDVK